MKKILVSVLLLSMVVSGLFANGQQEVAKFPNKPITIICPWSAGGGTDRTARFLAEQLSLELEVPVQVVNQTGGAGAVGHNAAAKAAPDGYTIGNLTFEVNTLKYLGYSDLTPADFRPLIQFNEDSSAVTVSVDSPYNTVKELLDAIVSKPAGTFIFSGSGIGTVWDLSRIAMLNTYGIDPNRVKYVPSQGAAPAITELLGKHVDVITCSYPEVASQVEGGKLKTLAIMADKRNPQFSTIPTLKEQGIDWSYGTWRGFAVPVGTPDAVVATLESALQKIVASDVYIKFMNDAGFGIKVRNGEDFAQFMQEQFDDLAEIFKLSGYGK